MDRERARGLPLEVVEVVDLVALEFVHLRELTNWALLLLEVVEECG
jgi:hypothetical protein